MIGLVNLKKDELRDHDLKSMGFTVLRYENKYVFSELGHALEDIKKYCEIE
ncbi:hypothetical protein DDD_0069 [Nonlabens dokdonensis DSW-6]|jgi:very-short-patch-repair endonuclease|uniref:DUF559 domain-containing protein n=2 Tax=Nonlabens dokdonensis TaxID=328515 RepID=L7W5X4_NONDD|nr:hypothetical protein DDD_0069 [Nonlabens dokdonensis DSW-6]